MNLTLVILKTISTVPHASGLLLLLAITTSHSMHTDHVDISQVFTQSDGKIQESPSFCTARTRQTSLIFFFQISCFCEPWWSVTTIRRLSHELKKKNEKPDPILGQPGLPVQKNCCDGLPVDQISCCGFPATENQGPTIVKVVAVPLYHSPGHMTGAIYRVVSPFSNVVPLH